MMTESLINVPFFFTEVINLIVSLNRISGFLDLDQVQECIVERNPTADEGQNAIEVKGNFSWGFSANKKKKTEDDEGSDEEEKKAIEVQPEEKENEEVPTLGKYMTLKQLDLEVKRGEFLCVIGDVGSGKSSLLNSVIGDMIYVPDAEVENFGGLDQEGDKDSFNELKSKVLSPDFNVPTKPVKLYGSVSYVEQVSWI